MQMKRHEILTVMRPIFYILIVFVFAQWWLTDLVIADEPGSAGSIAGNEVTVLSVYKSGGWVMHILLLCSVATIAVIVYCFIRFSVKKMCPEGISDTMVRLMQSRDVSGAYALCHENSNSFTNVLSAALLKVNFDRDRANKESMDQAAGEELDYEETAQMQWVNYLNVFATIAPMIGLFGTVLGMMQSFGDLSAGKSEPADLAGGINAAMGTTAGGLFVGIPAMFFYFFFRNRLTAIMSLIQKRTSFALDVLSGEVRISEEGTPEG